MASSQMSERLSGLVQHLFPSSDNLREDQMVITKNINITREEIIEIIERKYNVKLKLVALSSKGLTGELDESNGSL